MFKTDLRVKISQNFMPIIIYIGIMSVLFQWFLIVRYPYYWNSVDNSWDNRPAVWHCALFAVGSGMSTQRHIKTKQCVCMGLCVCYDVIDECELMKIS